MIHCWINWDIPNETRMKMLCGVEVIISCTSKIENVTCENCLMLIDKVYKAKSIANAEMEQRLLLRAIQAESTEPNPILMNIPWKSVE